MNTRTRGLIQDRQRPPRAGFVTLSRHLGAATTLAAVLALGSPGAFADTVRYSYDTAGRLAGVAYEGGKTIAYSYDPAGNLLSRSVGPTPPLAPNYQGSWWKSPAGSESGWGINLAHQGDTIFVTWFTYGPDGKPLWLVAVADRTATGVYAGPVSTVTGPPFNAVPFDPANVVETVVGTTTLTFTGPTAGTFAYTIFGISQTKAITRQEFATPVPTCAHGAQSNLAFVANFQDIWWNAPPGSESGWGINLTHQGNVIFATWFTYGADGKPLWFILLADRTAPNVYSGPVSTVTGPPFNAEPFDPAQVVETVAGNATLTFGNGNSATFAYTVNGISQEKQITRQVFVAPGTACRR